MKKTFLALFATLSLVFVSGCLVAPVVPPIGNIYSDIQAPLDFESNETIVSTRSGESTMNSYVGMVALGDASTHAAAQNGGLSVIHYADYKYKNIVGIIQTYTTVVYGE